MKRGSFFIVWLSAFLFLCAMFLLVSIAVGLAAMLGEFTFGALYNSAMWRALSVLFVICFAFIALAIADDMR